MSGTNEKRSPGTATYKSYSAIAVAMQEARKLGLVRIVRHAGGEPVYAITKKGERYVKAMPFATTLEGSSE